MELERLQKEDYQKHYQSFAACESDWTPLDEETALRYLATSQRALERLYPNNDYTSLNQENAVENWQEGRVVEYLYGFIRQQTAEQKCPLCGSSIPEGTEAYSRRMVHTIICSTCGQREAFQDLGHYRE